MKYINQQLLEFKLSCICVGTANFGYPTTETDAFGYLIPVVPVRKLLEMV